MSSIIKCDNCHKEIHSATWIRAKHLKVVPGNNPKDVDLCEEQCLVEWIQGTPWKDIEVYYTEAKSSVYRDPMEGVFAEALSRLRCGETK
jgi:hypothetical protein